MNINHNRTRDENLMIVSAVEEFGYRNHLSSADVLKLFRENHIPEQIRFQYEVLHMLPLSENADFAENLLRNQGVRF